MNVGFCIQKDNLQDHNAFKTSFSHLIKKYFFSFRCSNYKTTSPKSTANGISIRILFLDSGDDCMKALKSLSVSRNSDVISLPRNT